MEIFRNENGRIMAKNIANHAEKMLAKYVAYRLFNNYRRNCKFCNQIFCSVGMVTFVQKFEYLTFSIEFSVISGALYITH